LTKYASSVIKTYNVGEAKTQLSSLLDEVQRGVEVIVAKNGKPVARVTKIEEVGKRPMGFVKGRLTRAFFEPLPDEELAELAGRGYCGQRQEPFTTSLRDPIRSRGARAPVSRHAR